MPGPLCAINYKTMIKVLLFGLIFMISSCKKKTVYELQIGIDNLTEKELHIQTFPKAQYSDEEGYYKFNYDGSTRSTLIFIQQDHSDLLFITNNLNYKPHQLITEIFDSLICLL